MAHIDYDLLRRLLTDALKCTSRSNNQPRALLVSCHRYLPLFPVQMSIDRFDGVFRKSAWRNKRI